MATLSVLNFAEASLAEAALPALEDAHLSRALEVEDAALVTWQLGRPLPRARQLAELSLIRPLSPEFWQLFFASTWLLPIAIRALGAASHDAHSLEALGIENRFVRQLRRSLASDTSALLLLTRDATPDRVLTTLGGFDFTLLSASLTDRQQGALLAAFGTDQEAPRVADPSMSAVSGAER